MQQREFFFNKRRKSPIPTVKDRKAYTVFEVWCIYDWQGFQQNWNYTEKNNTI